MYYTKTVAIENVRNKHICIAGKMVSCDYKVLEIDDTSDLHYELCVGDVIVKLNEMICKEKNLDDFN